MNLQTLRTAPLAVVLAGATASGLCITGLASAQAAEPAITSSPVSASVSTLSPLKPIATLDLPRYMGRWYELAHYPNRSQRQCTGASTADYTLLAKGTVKVVHRCPRLGSTVDETIGEARRVGPEGSPTLQVRFAPAWLSFLPQVWSDYWVVELDVAYQLAVVSEPKREFLWALSREPSLPAAKWPALNARLQAVGFEPARLIRSVEP